MGISENSHAKIDKETQSPLLKIFKEIMTRERDDPEKRNLLNEPREDKKRRQYSVSKNKSDRRSCDSSNNSEHRKRGSSYKVSSSEQRADFQNKARSQSMPYQSEKKDSWWFWTFVSQQQNCNPQQARRSEDTCSCVSCALKKIVSSEYACIGCLLLLFTISIIVAFLVVFKSVPSAAECSCPCAETTTTTCNPKCKDCKCSVADSERLKRKIEMLNNKKMEKGFVGVNEFRKNNDKGYEDIPGHIDVPGVDGIDFGPSFRELNSVDESEHKIINDLDLSNVLDSDKNLNNMDSSGKLREFYKKLMQTDAKIKSLKKIAESEAPYAEDDVLKSPARSRRSLKLYHYPKRFRVLRPRRSLFGKHHLNETGVTKHSGNKTRSKRFGNESEEPTGLIIEKKKLLVQYKPAGKKRIPVKKCQHAPAGTHTHEKQMMHPFYKNSQRLDILLDKFLNKNLPEIMTDPFGLDDLFKHEKLNKPCKHSKPHKNVNIISNDQLIDQIPKPKMKLKSAKEKDDKTGILKDALNFDSSKAHDLNMLSPESTTQYEREFFNHKLSMIGKEKKKIVTPSSSDFEVLLSVSTIMNPDVQRVTKAPSEFRGMMLPMKDRIPNLRRLMQIEAGEEEENLGYEDFKEVLTDDMENHDETEKVGQRKRRDSGGENDPPAQSLKFKQSNPPKGVLNPNWKGAMPLYPDEINSMITNKVRKLGYYFHHQQERPEAIYAIQMELPKPTFEIRELVEAERKIRDLSDIEYVEDYLANKYNNLVQQAQAYSDYGVLDGKKESRNEKESPTVHTAPIHKIKLLADTDIFKAGMLERLKRGRASTIVKGEPRNEAAERDLQVTWTAQTGSKKPHSGKKAEGIRFELQPTTKAREDIENNIKIMKIVSKHIKLKPRPGCNRQQAQQKQKSNNRHFVHSTLISTCPNLGLVYSTKSPEYTTETTTAFKGLEELNADEKGALFAMTRGNRRLLSTKFESSSDFRDYRDSTEYQGATTESNPSSIDKFVDKLNLNKMSDSSSALKNYIEVAKAKNIKIYSTPQTYNPNSVAKDKDSTLTKANIPSDQPKDHTDALNNPEASNSIITINKSLVKLGDNAPENFLGKILMSVKDPDFGQQNFNLMFDVPIVTDLKEELMMMNDNINYPNVYNQFEIYTDSTIDSQVTETNYFYSEDLYQNRSTARRLKRETETEVTATWSEKSENSITEKDSKVLQQAEQKKDDFITVTTVPISFTSSKSSVSAVSSMRLKAANKNISALNSTAKANRCANYNLAVGDNMTLSDFFAVVGDWFKALEYGKIDKPRNASDSILTDMLLTLNSNSSKESKITTTDSAYPMYDSDMIENIGHRSRVLLSVEDGTANITDTKLVTSSKIDNVTAAAVAIDGNVFNGSTSTKAVITIHISNLTTTNKNKYKKTISPSKEDRKRNFKAIVKRNADDSNLIFWNDIYDDEYGIQTDKMDNYMKGKIDDAIADKQAVKKKDFLKRSGRWVQNKIRKFARKINPHSDVVASIHSDSTEMKERVPRSIVHDENFGSIDYPDLHDRVFHRPVTREKEGRDEIEEDYPDVDQKSLFAALSLNMKEVCKKAAKAVQETRNVDNMPYNLKTNGVGVRTDESKQGSIASALMQQLVRLLTDLVDYQVQQKTCTKLPPDLQTFLEWLTYSKEETEDPEKQSAEDSELLFKTPNQDDEELIEEVRDRPEEKPDFSNPAKSGNRELNILPGDRTQYLDIMHSVQDLLEQFDDMPDDEKSKMTGVKGYLERQLVFLTKQLSAYDLYAFFEKHDRKKRDIFIMQHPTTKHRPRRKPRKFFKNFGRKHTRTTAAYNDEAQVTDVMMNKKRNENAEINHNENLHQELSKRNLKDVYYKAVAEAKKFSTATNMLKKDEMRSFGTSTAKRQQ